MIVMPFFAMIVGFALALVIMNHYVAAPGRRQHELIWGLSFWLFGLGALAEVFGDIVGWHDLLAQIYYLSGAILAVTYLGVGEAMLLWPGRPARIALIIGGVFTVLALVAVFTAPIEPSLLTGATPWKAVSANSHFPAILAGISNGIGTLLVVGGALYSAWVFWRKGIQRQRMIGCILLAAGTLVVALGGVLAGWLGQHAWLYPPMAVGVAIMFVGYLQTTRASVPQPVVQPS